MNSQAFERPVNKLCCKCDLRKIVLQKDSNNRLQHSLHRNPRYARLVTLICVICFQWHWRHSSKPESLLRHSCIGVGVFDINCCYVAPQKSQKYCKSRSRGGAGLLHYWVAELKGWYTNQHDHHQNYYGFHHCHLHQNYLLSSWSLSTCRFWHLGSEHLEGDNVDKHYPDWAEIILLVFSFWNFQSILFMFWFSLFCSRSKLGCSSEKMIEWVKNCENEIGNA